MPKKVGKDVLEKKGSGIIRTKDYEKWKAEKLAEDQAKEERDEKKEQELHGKKIVSKMLEEREGRIEGLSPEEFAEMRALAKHKKLKVKKVVLKEEEE